MSNQREKIKWYVHRRQYYAIKNILEEVLMTREKAQWKKLKLNMIIIGSSYVKTTQKTDQINALVIFK